MRNKDIHHSKIYLILNFLTLIGYVILYPVITRFLEPSLYGEYILLNTSLSLLIGISNFGCKVGYRRNFFEPNNKYLLESLLFSTQTFIFIIFLFNFIIFISFRDYIFSYFNASLELKSISILLMISLMMGSFSNYYLIFLENKNLSKKYFLIFFLKTYIFFITTIFFLTNGYALKSIVYGLFLSNFFLLSFTIYLQFSKNLTKYTFNVTLLKEVINISIPSTPRSLFAKINSDLDKILIGYFLNAESVGIYSLGQSVSYSIFQIMTSLDKVFVPSLYKFLFASKFSEIGNYLIKYFFFCTLLAIGLVLSINLIVDNLFDIKYSDCKIIALIFSFYYLTLFFDKIIGVEFSFHRKVLIGTYIFFLNIFINLILTVPAVIFFGIYGAVLATCLSSLITLFISVLVLKKYKTFKFDKNTIILIYIFYIISIIIQLSIILLDLSLNNFFQIAIMIFILTLFLAFGYFNKFIDIKTMKDILRIR